VGARIAAKKERLAGWSIIPGVLIGALPRVQPGWFPLEALAVISLIDKHHNQEVEKAAAQQLKQVLSKYSLAKLDLYTPRLLSCVDILWKIGDALEDAHRRTLNTQSGLVSFYLYPEGTRPVDRQVLTFLGRPGRLEQQRFYCSFFRERPLAVMICHTWRGRMIQSYKGFWDWDADRANRGLPVVLEEGKHY
jgi:hypothetical protein